MYHEPDSSVLRLSQSFTIQDSVVSYQETPTERLEKTRHDKTGVRTHYKLCPHSAPSACYFYTDSGTEKPRSSLLGWQSKGKKVGQTAHKKAGVTAQSR